jgi:hypothetical protein
LHFTDNDKDTDEQADNYYRLWKFRAISDTLSDAYEKCYNPSELLIVDEVTVKFKEGQFSGSTFLRNSFRNQNLQAV